MDFLKNDFINSIDELTIYGEPNKEDTVFYLINVKSVLEDKELNIKYKVDTGPHYGLIDKTEHGKYYENKKLGKGKTSFGNLH